MYVDFRIMIVKKIVKYLTLLLCVVIATLGYVNDAECAVADRLPVEASTEFSTTYFDTTTHSGDISPASHICSPHTVQLTGAAKRTSNAHRHNFEYFASGKAINVCIENRIFKKSSTINTSFTKSEHRLFRLGKLII